MWYDRLKSEDGLFHFHIELTTKCNAGCPLCPRFVKNTPVRSSRIELWEMTIEQVKEWFPVELIQKVGSINFCGNFGDPCSCKDLYEIVEYFHLNNKDTKIEIRTNGGAQSVKFWEKIGLLSAESNKKLIVIFSVDGLEDTNDLYRRNVKWDILNRNITTFTKNGGYGFQEFLIFNHNEHQIEEASEQNKKWGLRLITYKKAFGFEDSKYQKQKPYPVYDKSGNLEYFLKPSLTYNNSDLPYDDNVDDVPTHINTNPDFLKELEYFPPEAIPKTYDVFSHLNETTISCQAETDHEGRLEVYINSNGDLRPCCHTGIESDRDISSHESSQLRQILSPKEDFSLQTNTFENIMKLFDEKFVNKWENTHEEGRCLKCSIQCGRIHQSNSTRLYSADIDIKREIGYFDSASEDDETYNETQSMDTELPETHSIVNDMEVEFEIISGSIEGTHKQEITII